MKALQEKQEDLEEKIRQIELKNKDYSHKNQLLWAELLKTRDRESSLERMLMLAFTCLASMNGVSFYNRDYPSS